MVKMLNRASLLTSYLSLSFFVQTWLRTAAVTQLRSDVAVRFAFIGGDCVVSLFFSICICYLVFADEYPPFFDTLNQIMGCIFGAMAVLYVVSGLILVHRASIA